MLNVECPIGYFQSREQLPYMEDKEDKIELSIYEIDRPTESVNVIG